MLIAARLAVAVLPFDRWRKTLGSRPPSRDAVADAVWLAASVEWAARRLPFETKCLPRAMALSWMLRRERIAHSVIFAVRPAGLRDSGDALHAWVETAGKRILGDLPGPWIETARLGQ